MKTCRIFEPIREELPIQESIHSPMLNVPQISVVDQISKIPPHIVKKACCPQGFFLMDKGLRRSCQHNPHLIEASA